MHIKFAGAALSAALLAACTQAAAPVDPARELEAIRAIEASQSNAMQANDIETALSVYAPNAAFIVSGEELTTSEEARRAGFEAMIADPNMALSLSPSDASVSASGDLAYTTATYAFTYTDPATQQPVTSNGHNLTVWRKDEEGRWRIVADFNVDAP